MFGANKYKIEAARIVGWGALLDVNEQEKQLIEPVRFFWTDENGLQEHEATKGYTFDGASKWFAWRLAGYPWGLSARSSLIHDRAFTERFRLSNGQRITFEYSAELYLAFLKLTGVPWLQRNIEYLSVLTPQARKLWNKHDIDFMEEPCQFQQDSVARVHALDAVSLGQY